MARRSGRHRRCGRRRTPALRFAARGLALSAWLKDPTAPASAERLDDRAAELAWTADEGSLAARPRRRSSETVARDLRALVDGLLPRFAQFDDPRSHDDEDEDEDAHWYIENAGGSFGDALEVEVAAQPLFAALAALVDLYGDVAPLLDAQPQAITSCPSGDSNLRFPPPPLTQYLSWLLVGELDWENAESAIEQIEAGKRDERREDLAELRQVVELREYRKFASDEGQVGAHQLFVATPHNGLDFPDVALAIGRLGRDGILAAAKVVSWSAPDPERRGPVERERGDRSAGP